MGWWKQRSKTVGAVRGQAERERDRFKESVLLGLKMEEGVMSHTIGRL